jgi:uncharacterized protein (TIGR03083 family)
MSPRPLRQFYDHDRTLAIEGLGSPVTAFRRHRARFLEQLATLTEDEWSRTTRCDAWDGRDVVNHLVSADGFWALTIGGRNRDGGATRFLQGFDPTSTPGAIVADQHTRPTAEVLAAFQASTEQLAAALDAVEAAGEWSAVSESPFGHVDVGVIAAHGLWDSWLHERDVLLPLGRSVAVEEDELLNAAAFTLFVGGAQGGVLDDDAPVGDGPNEPVHATLTFDEIADRTVQLTVDRDVHVLVRPAAESPAAVDAGRAVDLVEAVTGRAPVEPVLARLPDDLAAQLDRARGIL